MENETWAPVAETKEATETPSHGEHTSIPEKKFMKEALLVSGAILLGCLIISGSILTLVPMKQSPKAVADQPTNAAPTPEEIPTNVTVSIDDDAILGDKTKAKVAIVEFTDYECPFCKRFHTDTFDTLVKDYVDTGKAIIVTRDYPLSFHDPKATEAASYAECVRKEKGDLAKYTKKEQSDFSRQIEKMTKNFGGLVGMTKKPDAVFIIDTRKEHIALVEANMTHTPVISLSNTDNDLSGIDYPIVGNDASRGSVQFFVDKIVEAYKA
jgi:thiol-disulfide isomerase/thioredoxin